ncbi:hypothetical protein AAVH_13545 [Aphelenchoides avenae]|nr:hypothetical protein AAVH_13545 [Aphelenchus avenae]
MQTERGQPIEEKDGYLMIPHKTHKDVQAIQLTKDHNDHLPDPALTAYRVATNVKTAARANVLAPSGQLIDQHLAQLTQEEAAKVPRRSVIQRALQRARDHVQGGAVDSQPEVTRLPPVFQQTKDHQQDGARTNNSQEGWNRGFNSRFRRSKGKISKFLLRLQEDEEQTRQLLDRFYVFPADPVRGRRRHKTVIRDSQIRTMVVEYNALAAIDRTPEAKLELLRRIQFHLTS